MISGICDQALALASARRGLPAPLGCGIDLLPRAVVALFLDSLIYRLDSAEIARALSAATAALLGEIQAANPELAGRLQNALVKRTTSAA